jgi:hypothetical protein
VADNCGRFGVGEILPSSTHPCPAAQYATLLRLVDENGRARWSFIASICQFNVMYGEL